MKKFAFFAILVVFLLSACGPSEQTAAPQLQFVPKLTMYESGVVHFEVGVMNESGQEFAGLEDVNIRVVVTDVDGEIRNQMRIIDLGRIQANEEVYPLTYEAEYDPGRYVASLTGEGIPSLSVPFEIRVIGGLRKLAAPPDFIDPGTEFTLIDPDL